VSYRVTVPATVTATLVDVRGNPVATLAAAEPREPGTQSFLLDATGLADGTYAIALDGRAADGKVGRVTIPLRVDRAGVAFSASPRIFSPNADGRRDSVRFSYAVPATESAVLELTHAGTRVGELFAGPAAKGPQELFWSGSVNGVPVPDGGYTALLTLGAGASAVTHSVTLRVDTVAPRLRLLGRRPLRLAVSEAATLDLIVNGRRIRRVVPAGIVAQPVRGRLRTLRVVARDIAGNASAILRLR
jgi:hypothetical protein